MSAHQEVLLFVDTVPTTTNFILPSRLRLRASSGPQRRARPGGLSSRRFDKRQDDPLPCQYAGRRRMRRLTIFGTTIAPVFDDRRKRPSDCALRPCSPQLRSGAAAHCSRRTTCGGAADSGDSRLLVGSWRALLQPVSIVVRKCSKVSQSLRFRQGRQSGCCHSRANVAVRS